MTRSLFERWQAHPELAIRDIGLCLCAFAVLFSVTWSFLNYHHRRSVKRGRRSIVDTFTMLLFLWVFAWLVSRSIGVFVVPPALQLICIISGMALVMVGTWVNVVGRHQLGSTWSNQIAIYDQHHLLTNGLFGFVRHPLYASTIWMFLGASLAYLNWAALAATLLIFIPAMYYRAGQEERLLSETFPDYSAYRRRTGTFFPKLFS